MTDIENVPDANETYQQLFDDVLGWQRPQWLVRAEWLWCGPVPSVTRRFAVPTAICHPRWKPIGFRRIRTTPINEGTCQPTLTNSRLPPT